MNIVYKFALTLIMCVSCITLNAQSIYPKFGKGIQINAQDSSFYLKLGFRFQTLMQHDWDMPSEGTSTFEDHSSRLFIRRSRLKFSGWALSPKLKYKAELALSNRDNGGGNSSQFSNAANTILDASIEWNFHKNMKLWFGQGKLPGNRERVISSGNLQFVDRSRLNSRFTTDRDVAIMLKNHETYGENFILKQVLSISSGEGKNITSANVGGYGYAAKIEALPFGNFQSKGDYVGSAVKRESSAKLAIAVSYDYINKAGRTRGQKGSFIDTDDELLKDLSVFFVDFMYKKEGLSVMGEYAYKTTSGDSPVIIDEADNAIATYYTGQAYNLALGQFITDDVELAVRWTDVRPDEEVASNEQQYTFGLSKYIVGHKLKFQTDLTFRSIESSDNELIYRTQFDFHF